jgi:hypothetical protein
MRKDLDHRITPHESIILLCQDNPDIVNSILGFPPVLGTYASLTVDLRARLQKTERSTKSMTIYKNSLKESLMEDATRIGTKIQLSSIAQSNVLMMESIYTKKTEFLRQGEEPMIARMKTLAERAVNHEKDLMDLGVTPDQTQKFATKIAEFETMSGAAIRERQSRASSVERVEEKLKDLRELFVTQVEPYISSEARKHPDFYAEFLRKKRVFQYRSSKKTNAMPKSTTEIAATTSVQNPTLSEQLLRSIESVVNANATVVGLAPNSVQMPGEMPRTSK